MAEMPALPVVYKKFVVYLASFFCVLPFCKTVDPRVSDAVSGQTVCLYSREIKRIGTSGVNG